MSQPNRTSRRWCFTWNEFTDEDILKLENIDQSKIDYIIYGCEGLTEDKTPHLQGYLELKSPVRRAGVKKLLDPEFGSKSVVHVEPADAPRECNIIYCKKGQQSHDEFKELGVNGPNYGSDALVTEREYRVKKQGKRTDWDKIYDAIRDEPDYPTILRKFPEYAIKYSTGIKTAIEAIHIQNGIALANSEIENYKPRQWQDRLMAELEKQPDHEKIIWYVDKIGGCGKSTLCDMILAKFKNSMLFENGKTADIAHSWNGEQICLFDFSRSIEGRLNYGVIESIKNGRIYSGKYNGGLKRFGRPHVICFSNFPPDRSQFSEYKWDIRELHPSDKSEFKDETVVVHEDKKIEIPKRTDYELLETPHADLRILEDLEDNIADEDVHSMHDITNDVPEVTCMDISSGEGNTVVPKETPKTSPEIIRELINVHKRTLDKIHDLNRLKDKTPMQKIALFNLYDKLPLELLSCVSLNI